MSTLKFSSWQDLNGNEVANSTYPPGLVLVKSQTIGSGVSSVTVTGAFSSTFENYRITLNGGSASVAKAELRIKLGSNTSGYYGSTPYWNHTGADGVVRTSGAANDYPPVAFTGTTYRTSTIIDLIGPYQAIPTQGTASAHSDDITSFAGFLDNNGTSDTSFTLSVSSGTISGGAIIIYGYNNG